MLLGGILLKLRRILLFLFCFSLMFQLFAFADTDINVDGGGGGTMGQGTGQSYWSSRDDGIRVTIIDRNMTDRASKSIDFSNKQQNVDYFFGYEYKLAYMNGRYIYICSGKSYKNYVPNDKLPKIIYGDGTNSIAAIKRYFCDEAFLKEICGYLDFRYDNLISGEYALMIEPIAYFTYNGKRYAMTATEAAVYNQFYQTGDLRKAMGSLTHCNLPRSMYLQWEDLNIETPKQPFGERSTDDDIIKTLGVGIIRFDQEIEDTVIPTEYDYITDNDVITSFNIKNPMRWDCTPDSGKTVRFSVYNNDTGETMSIGEKPYICPAGKSQLVWIRWHTPKEPCRITIKADIEDKIYMINADVVDFPEVEPPNPEYYDANDDFKLDQISTHARSSNRFKSWNYWDAYKQYIDEHDYYWQFVPRSGNANISTEIDIVPDARVKTAIRKNGKYIMKSAYGVNVTVRVQMRGSGLSEDSFVKAQIVSARFPEFQWETYNRLLEVKTPVNTVNQRWELKVNPASYYDHPVHFTPLWYPDKTDYPVYIDILSCWTPAGQLTYSRAETDIEIDGNVYDDWYIRNY